MSHKIVAIGEIPKRKYTKVSVYDDIINSFRDNMDNVPLARVEKTKGDGQLLDGTYLSAQLRKRIRQRNKMLESEGEEPLGFISRTVNKEAYLQKIE